MRVQKEGGVKPRTIFAHFRLNRFCADASGRLYAYEDELSAERARKKATRGTKVVAIKVTDQNKMQGGSDD